MKISLTQSLKHSMAVAATALLLAACADTPHPSAPGRMALSDASLSRRAKATELADAIKELKRATARYHNLDNAKRDGFVFLHGCEVRGDEGPVGTVYINIARLMDGRIDPSSPDGLIYRPTADGELELVAAELAVPYPLWTQPEPPTFQGATFQREDEFGVYGLHAWVWLQNPEGLFAETNPNVTC